jgi:cation diffusion facilitator family transporter
MTTGQHHHRHDHDDQDGHGRVRAGRTGRWAAWRQRFGHLLRPHTHDTADKVDPAMETSRQGMRALWISLAVLGATAAVQAVVVAVSGSVALLGDTLHNVADALTAVPLAVAFLLGRRAATRRYTYGYGRAEDLAGIIIVATIAVSAALAGYQAITRLLDPRDVDHLPYVAAAGLVGFLGNELVARYRITVGRRIGSAALIADGLHARTDGFTSLAVLAAAGGAALGWRWADPAAGLLITAAILVVLKDAATQIYHRLMDAVDPALVQAVETTLRATPGVHDIGAVRLRWIGHHLRAETEITVAATLTITQAHTIAVNAEHRLIHAIPRLTAAHVHTNPQPDHHSPDPHEPLAHHQAGNTAQGGVAINRWRSTP